MKPTSDLLPSHRTSTSTSDTAWSSVLPGLRQPSSTRLWRTIQYSQEQETAIQTKERRKHTTLKLKKPKTTIYNTPTKKKRSKVRIAQPTVPTTERSNDITPEPLYQFRNQKLEQKWLLEGTKNLHTEIYINDLNEP